MRNHIFLYTKLVGGVIVFLLTNASLLAQTPHLEVDGDVKIRGYEDIHHPDDSTSVFIGANAGVNVDYTGVSSNKNNTFIGSEAGRNTTITASGNLFVGSRAGKYNTTGFQNVFLGKGAGEDNTTGSANIFIGADTGNRNTTGTQNCLIGGAGSLFNTTGSFNSSLGWAAGLGNIGSDNVFVGHYSGGVNGTGSHNTFVGKSSGVISSKGSYNTFIGASADVDASVPLDSLDRAVAIGYNAKVACSNCAVIGGLGTDSLNVGIGTINPTHRLHVEGASKLNGAVELSQGLDDSSILIGLSAGANTDFSSDRANTFIGYQSGLANTTGFSNTYLGAYTGTAIEGQNNTFVGTNAGLLGATGNNNTYVGKGAGLIQNSGQNNTFIGTDAGGDSGFTALQNAIAIGHTSKVACDNCAVIGDENTNLGIGTVSPESMVHIEGNATSSRPHLAALEDAPSGSSRVHFMNTNVDTNYWAIGAKPLSDGNAATANFSIFYRHNDANSVTFEIFGDGDATLAGTLTENSDLRLKTNIASLHNVLPRLIQLSAYSYDWMSGNRSGDKQIGLIAQEVQETFPELVSTDSDGTLSVSYTRFVPLLIEAVKEQEKANASLEHKLTKLESENATLQSRLEILESKLDLLIGSK